MALHSTILKGKVGSIEGILPVGFFEGQWEFSVISFFISGEQTQSLSIGLKFNLIEYQERNSHGDFFSTSPILHFCKIASRQKNESAFYNVRTPFTDATENNIEKVNCILLDSDTLLPISESIGKKMEMTILLHLRRKR